MIGASTAAYIFCALTAVTIAFQLALALGAPPGEMAMGGKYPGRWQEKTCLRDKALENYCMAP